MNESLRLVAPWWYWERQRPQVGPPRNTRPTIQKFDQPDFVPGFAKAPQRSLKFTDEDFVYTYKEARRSLLGMMMQPRPPASEGPDLPLRGPLLTNTGTRKLFLDTHKRYYVVVCELRCDAPGFPREATDDVCQAGFVVRRRLFHYDAATAPAARELLLKIGDAQRELADLAEVRSLGRWALAQRTARVAALKRDGTYAEAVSATLRQLQAYKSELLEWQAASGAHVVEEGWLPSAFDNIGAWHIVDHNPESLLDEQWYPLYPLLPDPSVAQHEAERHSLYFGVVPTSAFDTDKHGEPKFDSRARYHLRCFVRRHDPKCQRSDETPDCCGELVWSLPSEPYQLAPAQDLIGTSKRPVTIELPDLDELAALATPENIGKFGGARMRGKPFPVLSKLGFGQICFFAIPLITLIALFVLNIFLPIVVLLFSLWFLLALKFCLPPSFSLAGGLDAAIDASLQLPDIDAAVTVNVDGVVTQMADVRAALEAGLASGLSLPDVGLLPPPGGPPPNTVRMSTLVALGANFAKVDQLAAAGGVEALPDLTAGLEFEPRLTVEPSPV